MNEGKKPHISRIWNECRDEYEIARRLDIPVADVIAHLKTRKGYPGTVFKQGSHTALRKGFDFENVDYTKHGPTPKPTLPKLKFLGDC